MHGNNFRLLWSNRELRETNDVELEFEEDLKGIAVLLEGRELD